MNESPAGLRVVSFLAAVLFSMKPNKPPGKPGGIVGEVSGSDGNSRAKTCWLCYVFTCSIASCLIRLTMAKRPLRRWGLRC
jgi:hypothetical protein